jgi:FixJ family two-component response regulator
MANMRSDAIAIVDDDGAVLDSYRFVFNIAGFQVATYASAAEFLRHAVPAPRCLILDQHMPGMTGLELTFQLRREGVEVPTLLVTATPSAAILAQAEALGITRVLEKPAAESDLISFVEACGHYPPPDGTSLEG